MLAHSLGKSFSLDMVKALCKKYNLWFVEDCCDALGTTYRGQMVGTFGDIATLSFYPAHHITMGEGGAMFTNYEELKTISESFRYWGRDCYWCLKPPGLLMISEFMFFQNFRLWHLQASHNLIIP